MKDVRSVFAYQLMAFHDPHVVVSLQKGKQELFMKHFLYFGIDLALIHYKMYTAASLHVKKTYGYLWSLC